MTGDRETVPPPIRSARVTTSASLQLVGDEVELTKDDPRARLHLLQFVTEVEDDSHLKRKNKSERERPLPGMPTIGLFCSGNI
jgi:hypothetical protein